MELLTYLLKVSACTVLFFAFYLLVLRRLTFFKTNRFYLLVTLLLSFIIPTLNFTIEREVPAAAVVFDQPTIGNQETEVSQIQIPNQIAYSPIAEESFDWYAVLPYLYFGIVACLLIIATWRILQLVKHTKNGAERINGLKIVSKTNGFTNCSFFNYVFIDNKNLTEAELQVLLKHERVHAQQLHSVDKVLLIIAKAFLWFNPVVYLYDKALEQAHEYEADEATSRSFGTEQYANLLLRLAIAKSEMPLMNNFVKSPIKARIKMLFNSKSKNMKKLMYLLAVPVGLGLLWGFTVKVVEVSTSITNNEKPFTLVLDAGHGGKDAGAKVNGYSEKDIALAMANKIKALAEAKGIKVVTTRPDDENVSINERAKAEGTILLSLHINSSPKATTNGIEMITSGSYNNDLKLPKSNSITYYLYKELKNITGIKVDNKPKLSNILLLNQSPIPGVLLEMGYLTNKSDFDFITNDKRQDELAKLIVAGILVYKEKLPAAEEMRAKFQKSAEEFNVKYTAWKKSEKYTWLVNESKNFRAQTLVGKVESLNYVKFGGIPILDGFILSTNKKLYRIYIDKEQLNSISFKAGDKVSLYAPKAEVWFDSEYPAIKPRKVSITPIVGTINSKTSLDLLANNDTLIKAEVKTKYPDSLPKPVLLTSSKLTVDTKADVYYIKGGRMQVGKDIIEAENMIWDRKNGLLTADAATIKYANRDVVSGEKLEYDFKRGTSKMIRQFKYVPKDDLPSKAYQLISKLKFNADSIKRSDMLGDLLLRGNVKLNLDNYSLNAKVVKVDRGSNIITSYLGSIKNPDGVIIKADVIEFDMITKKINTDKKLP